MSGYKYNGVDLTEIFQLNQALPTSNGNTFSVISGNSEVGLKTNTMGNSIIYGVNAPDSTNTKAYIADTYYEDKIPYNWYGTANIGVNTMVSYKVETVSGTHIKPPNGSMSNVNRIQCLLIGGGGGLGGKAGNAKAKQNVSGNSAKGHGGEGGSGGNGRRLTQQITRNQAVFNGVNGESFDNLYVFIGGGGTKGSDGGDKSTSSYAGGGTKKTTGGNGDNGNAGGDTIIRTYDYNGGNTDVGFSQGGNGGNHGEPGKATANNNGNTKSNQGAPGNQGNETATPNASIFNNDTWKGNLGNTFVTYGIGGTANNNAGAGAVIVVYLYD